VIFHHRGDLFRHDLLHQSGQIGKMVVKRVAIDAAILYNVLNGDLIQGTLVEQLQKGFLDGPAGKVRHTRAPFFIVRPQYSTARPEFVWRNSPKFT
jgi:hypothetical protein